MNLIGFRKREEGKMSLAEYAGDGRPFDISSGQAEDRGKKEVPGFR